MNIRKILAGSLAAVMTGATLGFGAFAANYPSPFVTQAGANVAIVYGNAGSAPDAAAAALFSANLQFQHDVTTTSTTGSTGGTTGELSPLYTSSTKLWVNDTLNYVKSTITKTELPTLLAEGTFSGNVDTKYTQTVVLGSNPQHTFAKQPTTNNDPQFGFALSTTLANYVYNDTITFTKTVNFTHADSKNQELTLFGQKFTVGAATTDTDLVLLKSTTKLTLDSSSSTNPTSQDVTIEGNTYKIELISASATTATVKVTKADGTSDQKEVTEGFSKKINGVTIAVNTADQNTQKFTAALVVGSEKITLTDGSAVTVGDSNTVIDGTLVDFSSASLSAGTTSMRFSVAAPNSDKDALLPGESFVDPIFGTFKLLHSGLNVPENSGSEEASGTEDITVTASGDDKLQVKFTDYNGKTATVQYVYNASAAALQWDTSSHNIVVDEGVQFNVSDYVMIGSEDEGHLIKLSTVTNQTTGFGSDVVKFTDVFTGDTYETTITSEGSGTATIGGKVYTVTYYGDNPLNTEARQVRLDYPDSVAQGSKIIYPNIQTSNGAKIAFYEPLNVTLTNFDGGGHNVTGFLVPTGADTYQTVTVAGIGSGGVGNGFNISTTVLNATLGASASVTVAITNTGFSLNFTYGGVNATQIFLIANDAGTNIADPALFVYEEKDDNNRYEGLIVTTEPGNTGDDGIGVNDIIRTWHNDGTWDAISLASDSKKTKEATLFGTVAMVDSTDTDQKKGILSYPKDQRYGQIYAASGDATATATTVGGSAGGVTVTEIGNVVVADSALSVANVKNLVVIGGSCVNTVAASLLGASAPLCGKEFTDKTGVGEGLALAQVFDRGNGVTALLVAGYNAPDTLSLADYLTKNPVDTSVGKRYIWTTATKTLEAKAAPTETTATATV